MRSCGASFESLGALASGFNWIVKTHHDSFHQRHCPPVYFRSMDGELERAGERLLRDPRVVAVWGFGSRARGQRGGRRDVDLAVLLSEPLSLRQQMRLRATVVEALRRDDVDLVVLNDASPVLRHEVVATGTLLGERDLEAAERLEDRALCEYLDTAHLRQVQRRLTSESLK